MTDPSAEASRRAFAALVRRPASEIDLVRAALLIARGAYPALDEAACYAALDDWGRQVRARLPAAGVATPHAPLSPRAVLDVLNEVLIAGAGFHGNVDDYYDPRNSYLNEVIARRTGIPISLALVYIAVARRAGLRLHGVALPGHFLVGYRTPGLERAGTAGALYLDPFNGATIRSGADCIAWFRQAHLAGRPFLRHWLDPVPPRPFLIRLLNNLKAVYLEREDWAAAVSILGYLLAANPRGHDNRRLRGLLYFRLGAFLPALADLQAYLRAAPDPDDAEQIGYYLHLLQYLLVAAN